MCINISDAGTSKEEQKKAEQVLFESHDSGENEQAELTESHQVETGDSGSFKAGLDEKVSFFFLFEAIKQNELLVRKNPVYWEETKGLDREYSGYIMSQDMMQCKYLMQAERRLNWICPRIQCLKHAKIVCSLQNPHHCM